ncbi:MAG: hypothetical protein AB7E52_09320, partial [Bdellovibrionales bacterium]
TGLMVSPNIDFETYVETPDPQEGFRIMGAMACQSGVGQVSFTNFMGTEDPGLYWRFEYRDEQGLLWDFDNWLIPFSHPQAGMAARFTERLSQILTEADRLKILSIKKEALDAVPPMKPRGIDIYKAVLQAGVSDYAGFMVWQNANPPSALELWMP